MSDVLAKQVARESSLTIEAGKMPWIDRFSQVNAIHFLNPFYLQIQESSKMPEVRILLTLCWIITSSGLLITSNFR